MKINDNINQTEKEAYFNRLNSIIERTENFHHQWLLTQIGIITIMVMSTIAIFIKVSINNLDSDSNGINSWVYYFMLFVSLMIIILDLFMTFISLKQVYYSRISRSIEKAFIKGKIKIWTFSMNEIRNQLSDDSDREVILKEFHNSVYRPIKNWTWAEWSQIFITTFIAIFAAFIATFSICHMAFITKTIAILSISLLIILFNVTIIILWKLIYRKNNLKKFLN